MFSLEKKEIFRYLGYGKNAPDPTTEQLVNAAIEKIHTLAQNNYTYACYDLVVREDDVWIPERSLALCGKDIYKHLKQCEKVVFFGATLGLLVDRQIKLLENTDLSKAYILNAVATDYIEKLCDHAQEEINSIYADWYLTWRFSPGYGDLDLSYQIPISTALKTSTTIGLTVTENGLSIPSKSVTALIGLSKQPIQNKYFSKCERCNQKKDCAYTTATEVKKDEGAKLECHY